MARLSLSAKLYLYFGVPSLWRALLLPLPERVPMNGLEFEQEWSQKHTADLKKSLEARPWTRYQNVKILLAGPDLLFIHAILEVKFEWFG